MPRLTGAEPDVFFPNGIVTDKTVTITFQTVDGNGYCAIQARSNNPNLLVEGYAMGFVAYPQYAYIASHVSLGSSRTVTFRIRNDRLAYATGFYVDLFAAVSELSLTSNVWIGRINVFIEPSYANTHFAVTATSANQWSGQVRLDHPFLNNNPNRLVFASAVWTGMYNPHPVGVEFNDVTRRWHIVNQDLAPIPAGTSFVVKIDGNAAIRHGVRANNTAGHITYIDHPVANGNPRAVVMVTPTKSVSGIRNPNNIGVYYDGARWTIFNQDISKPMPYADFYVRVIGQPEPAPAPGVMVHVDQEDGWNGHLTRILNANWGSGAQLIFTPNWSPRGVYNAHSTGLWWDGNNWTVYNEDRAPLPTGAAFNVWRPADAR